ncbi:hypothetical protein [Aeromonas enteropelogenes]
MKLASVQDKTVNKTMEGLYVPNDVVSQIDAVLMELTEEMGI